MMKMSENSVGLSFSDSLNRPNKLLPKWMMHCKWGTCVCLSGQYTDYILGEWAQIMSTNTDNVQ